MLAPIIPRKINANGVAQCSLIPIVHSPGVINQLMGDPLYQKIDFQYFLRRQEPHRLVILSDDEYYAIQLAAYLAALRVNGVDGLLIVPPSALVRETRTANQESTMEPQASLLECGKPVLVAAPTGPVLTHEVEGEVQLFLDNPTATLSDVFIALKTSQIDSGRIDELTFRYGFCVCRVENASQEYLCEVLRSYLAFNTVRLSEELSAETTVAAIKQRRGNRFTALDLFAAVDRALQLECNQGLTLEHLLPPAVSIDGNAVEHLNEMIGLQEVKLQLQRMIATAELERRRGVRGRSICRNLTFAGSPGTGKSETARILAQALRESGCNTGAFREVGREALVGQHIGETSLKVEKLFDEVRGGVLFIDEAGALVSDERDIFAKEAVDALVRHMENSPETVVIFATYESEMEKLLSSNDGLRSRFSRSFVFPDYSPEELWLILKHIAARDKYTIPGEAYDICLSFFADLKSRKGKEFGNGREARRLFEHAVEELAVRASADPEAKLEISIQDLENASKILLGPAPVPTRRRIGF